MTKILINDGIHPTGKKMLVDAGYEVNTDKIEQSDLMTALPEYDAICVRSATKVRTALIDNCPNLKVIGRGGVGLDNIDVDYARGKGIKVVNTPAASSRSVAELVFAHLLSVARSLYLSNQQMPGQGNVEFKNLKKAYSKGFELQGKTLGVIGFGRIARETIKIALGLGMKVQVVDPYVAEAELDMEVAGQKISISMQSVALNQMLSNADIITLHIPFTGKPVLSNDEFMQMKDGVILINAARGGTVDEAALLVALESGKVAAAGLDVFENEPTPREELLRHDRVSVTPHIGASTAEAQEKIGVELAQQLIDILG